MALDTDSFKSPGERTVRIIRNTVANRKPVRAGDEVTVPTGEAKYLVGIRKAVFIEETAEAVPDKREAKVIPDGPTCATCGEPFVKRSPVQKYCSPECRP